MKKNKIPSYITGIIAIPMVIVVCALSGFMSVYIGMQKSQSLANSAENLSGYITSTYNVQLTGMRNIIENPAISAYLNDPTNPENQQNMKNIFFNTFNVNDAVVESTLISPDGNIYTTSRQDLQNQMAQDDYVFHFVLQTGEPQAVLEYQDETPMLSIGYPIKNGDVLQAVYKRVTPLNYISFFAQNANQNEEDVYILTKHNRGIFYLSQGQDKLGSVFQINITNSKYNGVDALEPILDSYLKNPEAPKDGAVTYTNDDITSIGGYYIIDDLDWICMISQPKAIVYSGINAFQLIMLLFCLIFVVGLYIYLTKSLDHSILIYTEYFDIIKRFLKGEKNIECDVNHPGINGEYGRNINELFKLNRDLQHYSSELEGQLTRILTTDPITSLNNNRALYNVIDEFFGQEQNQALIMIDTGIYDQINDTFGNSVSNRLLETVTECLNEYTDDHLFPARMSRDVFCLFINHFDDFLDQVEMVKEIELKLHSITHIDDLQIDMDPHVVLVMREDHLLGRSDWLRVAISALNRARDENINLLIYDQEKMHSLAQAEPDLYTNNIIYTEFKSSKNDPSNEEQAYAT